MNTIERFTAFFESAPDAVIVADASGSILLSNNQVKKLFGYEQAELEGEKVELLIPFDLRGKHQEHREHFFSNPKTREMGKGKRLLAKRKDGSTFYTEISLSPIVINDQQYVLASIRDVSDQVKLHEELTISNDQFKGAFEYSAIGMALVSTEGKWLKVNASLCKIIGYTEKELLEKIFQDITHPDDLDIDLEHVGEMLRGEIETYHMEKRYFHKNGSIVWVLLSVSLAKDLLGNPIHFVSQILDITQQKENEKELRQTLDIISEQNKRLTNFAYIVSHNLRTHTGNFQLLLSLLDSSMDEEEKKTTLALLKENANTLSDTIKHLNEVVYIQTNINITREKLNLKKYIDKTIDVLRGEINNCSAEIRNNVAGNEEINYNPAYLESVLLNVLTNAIKYRHPERTPLIVLSTLHENGKTVLHVADNGLGIDLKRFGNKLFGFYKTFHRNSDAKGLGLFITKNQVEALGGKIEVESTVNIGTTFKVFL